MRHLVRLPVVGVAAVVVAAAMVSVVPAEAAPKPKEANTQLSATVVSGSVATTRDTDPEPGGLPFDQAVTLDVQGTFAKKPLQGTLAYQLRVYLPRVARQPAEFLDAVTQSATFTSTQGDLTSETSWYALPIIGFECLTSDPVECTENNAVVLAFGAGTGAFANVRGNQLWTLRAEQHSSDGAVVSGTLTGNLGLGYRYCHTGQAATEAGAATDTYATATSLAMTSSACYSEYGDLIDMNNVPGGAMRLEYGFTWAATWPDPAEDPVVSVYPPRAASVWNGAGRMTGVVGSVHMGSIPPEATGDALMLGAPWGELTGLYASYKYALVRTWNIEESFVGEFPIGVRTLTPDSTTVGILAAY